VPRGAEVTRLGPRVRGSDTVVRINKGPRLCQEVLWLNPTILSRRLCTSARERGAEIDDVKCSWGIPASTVRLRTGSGQGLCPRWIGDAEVSAASTYVAHYAAAAQSKASRS